MRLTICILTFSMLCVLGQESGQPSDWRGWVNKGVQNFKSARYDAAAEDFQKSVDLAPNEVSPRLYLATVWMTRYIPGAEFPENLELARKAAAEFNEVLRLDPNNRTALESLAALTYQEAQGMTDLERKFRKLDESAAWYEKLVAADPQAKLGYYSLAVIDWAKWYAAWMRTRAELGMKPQDPGPFPNPAREQLRQEYSSVIEHGISNLEKALELDPKYGDAMAYINLLIRERADLRDTREEYLHDLALADQWVGKALAATNIRVRNRVAGGVQQFNLIRRVEPVYPPLARQARIQGTVQFAATIGADGHVQELRLISGHPLLVESARQAVMQWEYKPTLLNGVAVEVVTTVDVNFGLGLQLQQ